MVSAVAEQVISVPSKTGSTMVVPMLALTLYLEWWFYAAMAVRSLLVPWQSPWSALQLLTDSIELTCEIYIHS